MNVSFATILLKYGKSVRKFAIIHTFANEVLKQIQNGNILT